MNMRDQFAVLADNDVGPDDAIGTDRGPLADHSAILNPRGWIDRTHQAAQPIDWTRISRVFGWLARRIKAVQ